VYVLAFVPSMLAVFLVVAVLSQLGRLILFLSKAIFRFAIEKESLLPLAFFWKKLGALRNITLIFHIKSTILTQDSEFKSQNCSTLECAVNRKKYSRMKAHLFTDIGVFYYNEMILFSEIGHSRNSEVWLIRDQYNIFNHIFPRLVQTILNALALAYIFLLTAFIFQLYSFA